MSHYELIPEEAFDNLPDEPHEKFVALVKVAQSNVTRLLDISDSSNQYYDEVRAQFVSTIHGIAEALGIEGLPPVQVSFDYEDYARFQVYLAGLVSKVRFQTKLLSRPFSVQLGRINKARIQQEIEQLRHSVANSDLPQKKRTALSEKLDQLEEELNKQRLSFARTMAIAASIMTIAGGTSAGLANAPEAAETVARIIRWIGEDKEKEEAERERLSPPPKALPAPVPKTSAFDDLDDDVPF